MKVEDKGIPAKSATTTLEVSVIRNSFRPKFDKYDYTTTILETVPVTTSIFKLNGKDDDTRAPHNQLEYVIDPPHNYFAIDDNGVVSPKRAISESRDTEFKVSH